MRCYVIEVCAIPEGTCAIRGYGPKSGITDEVGGVRDVDATAVVEEAVAFRPLRGLEGAGG